MALHIFHTCFRQKQQFFQKDKTPNKLFHCYVSSFVGCVNFWDEVLGITVLAWGNSVGDLVADTALVRQNRCQTITRHAEGVG